MHGVPFDYTQRPGELAKLIGEQEEKKAPGSRDRRPRLARDVRDDQPVEVPRRGLPDKK
jgi:hypothetical protein